jgi:hypothetical protein
VVAGENNDVVWIVTLDDVDVLVDGVGRMSKLSLRSGRKKFQPRCKCRMRLCALYWVATAMRRMPEFKAFDSAKSMMRSLPPK